MSRRREYFCCATSSYFFCLHPTAEHAHSAAGSTTCSNKQQQQQQRQTHTTRFPITMSSNILLVSAVPLLLAGTATTQYFEMEVYTIAACQDLASTSLVDGAYGDTGVEAFGACTNLTGLGTGYSSSMFDCIDNEAILTYFESETCSSGDADVSSQMSNSTCHENNQISRCTTEDPDWSILSDWTVDATFYLDASCSTATGETDQYTMSEVLQVYGMDACALSGSSVYVALRCINGVLGTVTYGESDSICSSGFTMASVVASSCSTSIFGVGPYMVATCSESSSTEGDDSSSGDSSLVAGMTSSFGWLIGSAAAGTVLVAVFG